MKSISTIHFPCNYILLIQNTRAWLECTTKNTTNHKLKTKRKFRILLGHSIFYLYLPLGYFGLRRIYAILSIDL